MPETNTIEITPEIIESEFNVEEARAYIADQTVPERYTKPVEVAQTAGDPPPVEADKETPGEKSAEEIAAEALAAEEAAKIADPEKAKVEVAPVDELLAYKIPDDVEGEKFDEAAKEYLEKVELPPAVQQILDHKDKLLAESEAKTVENPYADLGEVETVAKTLKAVNRLADFREIPDVITGKPVFVPDTTGIRELLDTDFAKEKPQFLYDLNTEPSKKYPGATLFQQFIKDGFDLDAQAMETLNYFVSNKGQMPLPPVVPEGIDQKFLKAFWLSEDRVDIEARLDAAQKVLADQYADEGTKAEAREALRKINSNLSFVQNGIDARDNTQKEIEQQRLNEQNAVSAAAAKTYLDTSVVMLRDVAAQLKTALADVMDEGGSGITGLGYAALIEKALTDDEWAKYAQEDLAKEGVKFDWKKGREVLDQLWQIEHKLAAQEKAGANPRAIEASKQAKSVILKELKGYQKEVQGQIIAKAVGGASKKLEAKTKDAPKVPVGRTKPNGTGTDNANGKKFEDLPLPEMRQAIREAENDPFKRAAFGGDLGGFADE